MYSKTSKKKTHRQNKKDSIFMCPVMQTKKIAFLCAQNVQKRK